MANLNRPLKRAVTSLAILILLFPTLNGGGHGASLETANVREIHWGLGLNTSVKPQAAPFAEAPSDLAHLFAFANASIEPVLGRCPTDTPQSWISGQARIWNMNAFQYLENSCDSWVLNRVVGAAYHSKANGTELAFFAQEWAAANASLATTLQALKSMPVPGTYADAEFQGWLISALVALDLHGVKAGTEAFQSYLENRGQPNNDLNLKNAVNSVAGSRYSLDVIAYLASHYPWQAGKCSLPLFEQEMARAYKRFNETLSLAAERGNPEDRQYVSSPYGLLLKITGPALDYYSREGFVVSLVKLRVELAYGRAYWENVTRTSLPTADEARYLVDLHRSKVRSLSTEFRWANEDNIVDLFHDHWQEDPAGAVGPLALQAVTFPFSDVKCTGAGGS